MRKCIFCEGRANSAEHAMPNWILELLAASQATITLEATRGTLPTRLERGQRPAIKVRFVCTACNNGWMATLENRAKSILMPPIFGRSQALDVSAQGAIATWAIKTAMVFECTRLKKEKFYRQPEREAIRMRSALPPGTGVWVASRETATGVFADAHFTKGYTRSGAEFHGYYSTFCVGHFVVQAFTPRLPSVDHAVRLVIPVNDGPWGDATRQVWPVVASVQDWPPPLRLDDQRFIDMSRRWGGYTRPAD
jgi:hypothetical protein